MTAEEIKQHIKAHYPRENEFCEHKAFSNLRHSVSGSAGNDIISYASAISNMEGGTLIIGVEDKTLDVVGITDFSDYTAENLPPRIIGNCVDLSSLGLRVEELRASDTGAVVWILFIPKHFPRRPVIAHRKAWQRIGDNLIEMSAERREAILAEPMGRDWTAEVIPSATIADLSTEAISLARQKFKENNHKFGSEIDSWDDLKFLDKAKITAGGQITRACLLLLGTPESVRFLSPAMPQITWKLQTEEKAYEHFSPPFLLNTSKLLSLIRNVRIKLFPENQLIAVELMKYETRVILEALHNCIAHQNYELNERTIVTELPDRLRFENSGEFIDGNYEQYISGNSTPRRYRNPWLANAMVTLGMIDTMGYGIHEMFMQQKKRNLPLPDYSNSDRHHVVLEIFGHIIDERYSRLLMAYPNLTLDLVIGLDRIQKRQPITDEQMKVLRQSGLIEGRKPNFYISSTVADKIDERALYTKNRGLDESYYKELVIKHLQQFGSATRQELEEFLIPKLPDVMSHDQKRNKVKNLLSAMRLKEKRLKADRSGPGATWSLNATGGEEEK